MEDQVIREKELRLERESRLNPVGAWVFCVLSQIEFDVFVLVVPVAFELE